jgi:hypothetical protein
MPRHLIRSAAAALALGTGLLAVPVAQAGAFSGAALFDLFVLDIRGSTTGLTLDVIPDEDEGFSGDASADAGVAVLGGSDPFGFELNADSFIDGEGDADAFADAYATVEIFNDSGADVEIDFEFLWDLEATAERISGSADAISDAFVDMFVDGVVIDGTDSAFEAVTADAIIGPLADAAAGDGSFTLLLTPGETAFIDIVASSFGESVPAPPALALMGLGLGVLGWVRRARGAAVAA